MIELFVLNANCVLGVWAVLCAGVCTDTLVRSWQWRSLRSLLRRWHPCSWRRWKPPHWKKSKYSTWRRDTPPSVCCNFALVRYFDHLFFVKFTSFETVFVFSVTLIDSYESTTFIFLVFDLWVWNKQLKYNILWQLNMNIAWYESVFSFNSMRRGELFDYLTEKVTLSEKETRWAPASKLWVLPENRPQFNFRTNKFARKKHNKNWLERLSWPTSI